MKRGLALVILLLALGAPFADAAPVAPFRNRVYAGRNYLNAADVARYFGMRLVTPNRGKFELRNALNRVTFSHGKRYGTINGVSTNFSFPPVEINGRSYISANDFQYQLLPFLSARALRRGVLKTIMLDPGHGGRDQGAAANGVLEKNLTLAIAMRVKKRLEASGYRVLMTRNRDRDMTLQERTELANRYNPDLFLSIHINAVANANVDGIESFVLTPPGAPSSGSGNVGYAQNAGNAGLLNSAALGLSVQHSLLQATGAKDRGLKRARFLVLRDTRMPGMLLECGFITNRSEAMRLSSAAYQEKIAAGIVAGVKHYHARTRR